MENRNGYYNPQGNNQSGGYYGNSAGAGYNGPYRYSYAAYQQAPRDPFINREARHITKLSLLAGAAVLSFIGMQNIMGAFLSLVGLSELYMSNYSFQLVFGTFCSVVCVFVPFVAVYGLYSKGDRERCFDFGKPVSKKSFLLAVSAGLMICLIGDYIASGFNSLVSVFGVSFTEIEDKTPQSIGEFLLFVLECAVVPALVEEFAVRGVIMQPLRRYGDRFAIVMSSLAFAMMHGNMMQIPVALIAGFALGYFAIATKSIWTSVAIHFANNLFTVLLITANSKPVIEGVLSIAVTVGIIIAGSVCLVKFINTEHIGLGLTAGPKAERYILAFAAAIFLGVSLLMSFFEGIAVIFYMGAAAMLIVFFLIYRSENRKALGLNSTAGLPEKLMVSLYLGAPTVVLAYYSLTIMTVDMVSSDGLGGKLFSFMLFVLFFAVSFAAISNVRKSTLLENKKAYTVSLIAAVCLILFTAVLLLIL